MNDRFSADLRRHLLATAEEHPADGQLAALDVRLAATAQRHPLIARLPWGATRTAGATSTAIRYGLVAVALIGVIAAAAVFGGGNTAVVVPTASLEPSAGPSPTAEPSAPEPTRPGPTLPVDAHCVQFDAEGTYLQNVGTLPVSLTVPGTPARPWRGDREAFSLGQASCASTEWETLFFEAALVGRVYTDPCHWEGSEIEVPTAFLAAEELAKPLGDDTSEPIETTVGPFRATRLDVAVPDNFDDSTCDDTALRLWADNVIVPGMTHQVYVLEVDGTTLVITARYFTSAETPALLDEIDAILATLRVDM